MTDGNRRGLLNEIANEIRQNKNRCELLNEVIHEIRQALPETKGPENPHALHEWIKDADRLQNACDVLSYHWGRLLGAAEFSGMGVLELLDFYEVPIYFDADKKALLGKEAEELRAGIAALINSAPGYDYVPIDLLQRLLDSTDARDSLAYLRGKDKADEYTAEEWAKAEDEGRCNPGCRGWTHFNVGDAREGIELCMDCGIFETDEEAADAHDYHCTCGAHVLKAIMYCHRCDRDLDVGIDGRMTIIVDERAFCSKLCAEQALISGKPSVSGTVAAKGLVGGVPSTDEGTGR